MTPPHDPHATPARHHPGPRRRRRILPGLAGLVLLALAGAGAWFTATEAVNRIEARSAQAARTALAGAGLGWAAVRADGLQLVLTGTAPDEAARLQALTSVGAAVPVAQIIDEMAASGPDLPPAPPFEVEILANADGVSLVGLVPTATDRAALGKRLAGGGAQPVSDLLAMADRPEPAGWAPALDLGVKAVGIAPQAKISIRPGAVTVSAIAPDEAEKTRIEQALLTARPEDVALRMDIRAPLPVIAPFTLRFALLDGAGHLDQCAADSVAAREAIIAATGLDAQTDCPLGIGAPNADWSAVAVTAITALHDLGAGAVTMSDRAVLLELPASVAIEAQEATAAALRAALPPPYRLEVLRITPASIATEAISFSASLAHPGDPVQLRGHVTNDQMRVAIETVARARFRGVDAELKSDEAAPGGWTIRVVAGIEALSRIDAGSVVVTPDLIQVEGVAGNRDAPDAVLAGLTERLGEGARYAVRLGYDRRLDPDLGLPDGETCVARLNAVLDGAGLRFAPSAATFEGDIAATLADLGEAMTDCGEYRIEIGGHTDSQGSAAFNDELSQKRAEAVLAAMAEAGIAVENLSAHGYGPAQPVATNDTAEGREQNRRIEMRLIAPEPVGVAPPEPGELIIGMTEAADLARVVDDQHGGEDATAPAVDVEPAATSEDEADDTPPGDEDDSAEVPSDPAPGYSPGETPDGAPPPPQPPGLD